MTGNLEQDTKCRPGNRFAKILVAVPTINTVNIDV